MGAKVWHVLLCIKCFIFSALAINHWILNENGKILQKIDSPFYLREPNNLVAFLDQVKHNEIVENTYMELLRKRELMAEQINFSIQFGMEIIEQAKCALDFYMAEKQTTYLKITKNYLKRINVKISKKKQNNQDVISQETVLPFCWEYIHLKQGVCCYEHLESLGGVELKFDPETELGNSDLEFGSRSFLQTITEGLAENPMSWKYHTLSSFYWRLQGDAHQAVECVKRGIMLSPQKFRDISLLSLGIILYRAGKLRDSEVLFSAAVESASEIAENHFALGVSLAMMHEFNKSINHFDIAEKLDPSFIPKTLPIKNFISCVENLTKKTAKMYNYVEYIKSEVSGLKHMKNLITQSHEKLVQQQVPLTARYFDSKTSNEELIHRGQYCSTRTMAGTEEPILFCDFYSDLQMRLESKDVDIESLERDLKTNSEAIIKQLSKEFHTFNFEKFQNSKCVSGKNEANNC